MVVLWRNLCLTKTIRKKKTTNILNPKNQISQTQHQVTINGEEIKYTVTAGTILLRQESKREEKPAGAKAKASIFFIAYTKDDVEDVGKRPVNLLLQRRPWLIIRLAAHGRVRPAPHPHR